MILQLNKKIIIFYLELQLFIVYLHNNLITQTNKMKNILELSKNLKLTHIDVNNCKNGKLIAVVCYFTFFGEHGEAYILVDKLDGDYASYGMTEIYNELSDSFNEQLEDEDNWTKIVSAVKDYIKEWETENEGYINKSYNLI
jgi:hypothetical protein